MWAIEWTRERRRILIPALVLAPYPVTDLTGSEAKALIDTGSSISGVARRVADELNLTRLGKRPLTSAQGQGQVERCAFRLGLRPDREVADVPVFPFVFDEVIGIELTNAFEFEALIGMDILGQCDFSTSRDGRCSLRFG
jgi:hypothetical protein